MDFIATSVKFLEGVTVECTFIDGKVCRFDMSTMFEKYPQLEELRRNRVLFESGKLDSGGYGIVWSDELDFYAPDIHDLGIEVGKVEISINQRIGIVVEETRESLGLTQTQLAKMSGIDQSDISRIEVGKGNPTLKKVEKLFSAMGKTLEVSCK